MKLTLTPTRAQLGARCHRRHALTDVALLTKTEQKNRALIKHANEHAAFGSVIHAGGAEHWRYVEDVVDQAVYALPMTLEERNELSRIRPREAVERTWDAEFSDDTQKYSKELAISMIDGYTRKARRLGDVPLGDDHDAYKVVSIEKRIEVQIGRFRCTFMLDRLYQDVSRPDHYIFVDTKTAGTMRAGWYRSYDVSLQMKLYYYALFLKYGSIPEGIIEGVLKKVPTQIEYHPLPEWGISILEEAAMEFTRVAEADEQLVQVATDKASGELDLDALWELAATQTAFNDNDCYAYGEECPFLALCTAPVADRLGILKSAYTTYEPDWE